MQKPIVKGTGHKEKRAKQEAYLQDIEDRHKGNPLLKGLKDYSFPPETEQDKENKKYLDYLGNPLPGYRWIKEGNISKVVPI